MTPFKAMRRHYHLTLKQLGERTGLSISFLSDLERGRTEASMKTLRRLARCYGVSVGVFIDPPDAPAETPVPSFEVRRHIQFQCVRCGAAVQFNYGGVCHDSSSDFCPQCRACYRVQWKHPLEQSSVMLMARRQEVS